MLYSLPANTAFIRYFRVVLSIQAQAKDLLLTRCQQLTDHMPQQCLALVFLSYRIILFLVWYELRGSQFLTHDVRYILWKCFHAIRAAINPNDMYVR